MKYFIISCISLFLFACSSKTDEGVAVVNLAALSAMPLDKPIDELAKGNAYIEVKLPQQARIDELSKEDLAKLKAAAYRFYQHVTLVNNQYVVDIKDPKSLHISEDLVKAYQKAIEQTNHFADSMRNEGQTIQLPAVSGEYLERLLK